MKTSNVLLCLVVALFIFSPVSASICNRCNGATNVTATIDVNYTFTGAPGTDAMVVNVGNNTAALLDFTIPSGVYASTWYNQNVASADIAGYYVFSRDFPSRTEGSLSRSAPVAGTEYLIGSFATAYGDPYLTTLPKGTRTWNTYAKVDSLAGGSTYIVIRFYKRNTAGTETELYNLTTHALSTAITEDITSQVADYDIPLNVTDRFVAKYFVRTTSASTKTATLYFDDTIHASNAQSPIAQGLQGPPGPAGTAINESYAYLPGRAGGQVLTGGTQANDDLILNGTSSGTKTTSYVILQPDGGKTIIGNLTPVTSSTPTAMLLISRHGTGFSTFTIDTNQYGVVLGVDGGSTSNYFYVAPKGNIMRMYDGTRAYQFDLFNAGSQTISLSASKTGNTYFNNARGVAFGGTSTTATIDDYGTIRIRGLGAGTLQSDAGGNITSVSDSKYKTNINPLKTSQKSKTTAIQKIQALTPVSYHYSQDSGLDTTNTYTGFLAQDVEAIIPEAVSTKADVKYEQKLKKKGTTEEENEYETIEVPTGTYTKSLDDRAIIAQLVLAMQEQQAEIDALQARIDKLEKKS